MNTIISPEDAARNFAAKLLAEGFILDALHAYMTPDGSPIYWRIRLKHPNGKKWIRPMHQDSSGKFILSEPPHLKGGLKPLYCQNLLIENPTAIVFIMEGEKKTDVANQFFACHDVSELYIAITSGGATSAEGADWKLLAARDCIIFPDNDEAGIKYASQVNAALNSLDCKTEIIDSAVLNLPEGGDVVDWLNINPDANPDDLMSLPRLEMDEQSDIDPLEGLVELVMLDPGEAFKPEVITALINLKESDRAAFISLRAKLRKAQIVTELDKAMSEESGFDSESGPTQAEILVDLASNAELFHAPNETGYADVVVNEHRETWPIRSRGFKRWLIKRYYDDVGSPPNSEALSAALNVIEAKAHYNGPEREVFTRVAAYDGKIYLDLCNEKWEAVEIDENGWRIISDPPVRFRRSSGMLPLATPQSGGNIQMLRRFLNVKDDNTFVLAVSWLLAALRGSGPYPVLCLSGEQGSAKSSFMNILRRLIDPNTAPLRTLPREDRDLFIAANNGYVLAFDNLSKMPEWISDTLCRLATGGGFATRQLYSDQDEALFNAMRPIILNGIEDFVTRPDLGDRSILSLLQQIPEDNRKAEKELYAEFDKQMPLILGALLDAVAHGLKRLPFCILKKMPRMADFALWGMACETAFWPAGTFMSAYEQNRANTVSNVLEGDAIASAVQKLMDTQSADFDGRTEWTGTSTQLLAEITKLTAEIIQKTPAWPKTPRGLSGQLRRIAPFLRKTGIVCDLDCRDTDRNRSRLIKIIYQPANQGNSPSASSKPSAKQGFHDIPASDTRTQAHYADNSERSTVQQTTADTLGWNGTDGMDAKIPPLSGHADSEVF